MYDSMSFSFILCVIPQHIVSHFQQIYANLFMFPHHFRTPADILRLSIEILLDQQDTDRYAKET